MLLEGFDWDAGNEFKNECKHGLTRDVVEAFFGHEVRVAPDTRHSADEERFLAIGNDPVSGRPMVVAFTFRHKSGKKLLRPISARHMHAREVKQYGKMFTQNAE